MQQVAARDIPALIDALRAEGRQPQLLDVREPIEVAHARIAPAGVRTLCIPMAQIPGRLSELDAEQPVIALCHHGMRSAQVLGFLERHGFDDTYNVAGGIDAWSLGVDPAVPRY